MSAIDLWFADYAAHHRTPANKATHAVGIPLIVLCLLGLAGRLDFLAIAPGVELDLALILGLALVAFYSALHAGLGLGAFLLLIPLYLLGERLPLAWQWGLLALGVALQYLGHWFEGKQPAFHRNLIHTLVGPLWMAALLFRALGVYRPGAADGGGLS